MAITRTPIIDDDGTGTTGTVLDNAWKQELYDQIDAAGALVAPAMQTLPYSASNYSIVGAGAWTVDSSDQIAYRYRVVNKVLALILTIQASTVVSPVTFFGIKLPPGMAVTYEQGGVCVVFDGGTPAPCYWAINMGDPTKILIGRMDGNNFSPATNATQIRLNAAIEIG